MSISEKRIFQANQAELKADRQYVLYWAQMNRRVDSNHGLLHAVELGNQHGLPVLYYEGLTCSYPYANDRLHTFILGGVPETEKRLKKASIGYVFYLRKKKTDQNDILYRLAAQAAAIVTDDYPVFIARQHNESVAAKIDIPYLMVDSSCIVPMRSIEKRQYGAYTIRPRIHKLLPEYLKPAPELKVKHKFSGEIPAFHTHVTDDSIGGLVAACEIDHSIAPSLGFNGGRLAAENRLRHFLEDNLHRYATGRNDPSAHVTSEMSPYLHFGQLSSLEIALAAKDYASKHKLIADEFLEELIVRRELSFNYSFFTEDPSRVSNLPDWVQQTLKKHLHDKRDPSYTIEQLEAAETGDDLWNATQNEMKLRGKIHGYYRMYWGKKIIEWLPDYQQAVDYMIDTHGRYALDGRDPNTYTNILWCLGLHDRAWGERPIFGKIRYMSGDSMRRKTNSKAYISEIDEIAKTGRDPHGLK